MYLVIGEYVVRVIGTIGILVIVYGVLLTVIKLIKIEEKRIKSKVSLKDNDILRITLGKYLLLGLEFLIAADVIKTILKPSLEEVAILGAIVVIRTVISYFLNIETEKCQLHQDEDAKIKI